MLCDIWQHDSCVSRLSYLEYAEVLPNNCRIATRSQLVTLFDLYLEFSGHVTEAIAKLEILKALEFYDTGSTLYTLMAEIEVSVARGDYEQVVQT